MIRWVNYEMQIKAGLLFTYSLSVKLFSPSHLIAICTEAELTLSLITGSASRFMEIVIPIGILHPYILIYHHRSGRFTIDPL